jgi:GT2 family glycosyltransferase
MSTIPVLSVIVPTYERQAALERLLRALVDQTLPHEDYEVVICVDGSTDDTRAMLGAFDAPYPLIWHWQPNSGRAAARNAAIARARGGVLVLLDDDMEPARVLLSAHLAEHPPGSRRCVMGAAPVVFDDHASAVSRYVGRKFNSHLDALARAGRPLALRDFYSGNFSVRRDVLIQAGGFDEAFKVYGNEDLELCWRLRQAGVEIVFSAAALAYQHYTKDFAALARDTLDKGRTAVLLATKHPGARPELKLGTYATGSARRRLAVRALLALNRLWPGMRTALVNVMGHMEKIQPPGLERAYGLTLDYFYWRGAIEAGARLEGADEEGEAGRNRALRRVDWRVLLPDPRPRVSVCFRRDALPEALREGIVRTALSVIDHGTEPEGGCDLAVAVMPDQRTLRQAFTCLRAGGACYAEYHGLSASPRAVRRALNAAGFEDVRTYWPWPSAERCIAWIPLDDPVVASDYLRRDGRVPHALPRRIVRASRRQVMRVRQRAGLTMHVSAIGSKGPASAVREQATASDGFMAIVREHWTEWGLGSRPSRLTCVLQTGGSRSISKVIAFVSAAGDPRRALVVKIARIPEAADGLRREAKTLDMVRTIARAPLHGMPRVLFRWDRSGVLAIGETALPGVPITGRLARARYDALARSTADWLAVLAVATHTASGSWNGISSTALRDFERAFQSVIRPALPARIEQVFGRVAGLPTVCEHRDVSPWNVLVHDRDELSVLDWESSEPVGVPALDLIYFLSHLAFYHDGLLGRHGRRPTPAQYRASYRAAWNDSTTTGRANRACLRRYAERVGVDVSTSHALRLLTWLLHSRSEYQRAVEDHGGLPSPDTLRGGLFLNLLHEEAEAHGC